VTIRDIAIAFGYQVDKASEKKANASVKALKDTATKLLGAIGIGFSLVKLKDLAEEFNGINDKIRDATRDMGDQLEIQQQIMDAANNSRMSYSDMADSISKLTQNKDVFGSVEEAAGFAELMAKEFKASGKSTEEVNSLMSSITTSISKGEMNSRAMMALFRESPKTLNMMADSLGVSTAALQDMVSKGQVSAETLKNVFTQNADEINSRFGELEFNISDALRNIRNQWGLWVDQINSTLGITKTVAAFMVKSFNRIMSVLRKAQDAFIKLADKMGGVEKMMKLLTIAGGAILLALNADKIMGFLKMAGSALGGIKLKTLALVAVIVIVALIIEDLVNFMQGNDSLIGSMLGEEEAAALREQIQGIVDAAKALLPKLAEIGKMLAGVVLKAIVSLIPLIVKLVPIILKIAELAVNLVDKVLTALMDVLDAIMPLVEELIEIAIELIADVLDVVIELLDELIPIIIGVIDVAVQIVKAVLPPIINLIRQLLPLVMQIIKQILPIIISLINTLLPLVMQIINAILPVLINLINTLLPLAMQIINMILPILINWINTLLPLVLQIINTILPVIINLINTLLPLVMQIIDTILPVIINLINTLLPLIMQIIETILPVIIDLVNTLLPLAMQIIETILPVVLDLITAILPIITPIVSLISSLVGTILPPLLTLLDGVLGFLQPILDMLKPIADVVGTVVGGLADIAGGAVDLLGGVVSGIGDLFGFAGGTESTPDTFVAGENGPEIIAGAKGRKVFTAAETGNIADTLGGLMAMGSPPSAGTVGASASAAQNVNITQNVDISNTFNGDRAGQQKSAEAMDGAASYATDFLARGLAYVR